MAGTTWPTLLAGRKAKASEVESKFDWIEGDIIPMSAGNSTDNSYKLGTSTARWNSVHTINVDAGASNLNLISGTKVQMSANLNEALTVDTNGSIGMGVNTAPSANLDLKTVGNTRFRLDANNAGGDVYTTFQNQADSTHSWYVGRQNAGTFLIGYSSLYGITDPASTFFSIQPGGAIAIGGLSASSQALLDIQGTKALIVPRLSTAERDTLTAADGMVIYNTTTGKFNFRENSNWNTAILGPSFRVTLGTAQSGTSSGQYTVGFDTKDFDTNDVYTTSTFSWTPGVIGKYYLHAHVVFDGGTPTITALYIQKNGSSIVGFYRNTENIPRDNDVEVLATVNTTTDSFIIVADAQGASTPGIQATTSSNFEGYRVSD